MLITDDTDQVERRVESTVAYSVLGPVSVSVDGTTVTPRAFKLRVILAVLLVRANTIVSLDALVHELWGENPPRTAVQALRVYISQLRQIVCLRPGRSDGARLVTQAPGYRLEVDPETLDASRFEMLCRWGVVAQERAELKAAGQYYRQALDLRRGTALSDVRSGFLLQSVALELDERVVTTLLRRIDIDLRLGNHDNLVAELRSLESTYPLHEGLQARLMLALCNVGRTKEALEVYRSVRDTLIDELGIEPNAVLRTVHEAILNADDEVLCHGDLSALNRLGR